MIPSRADIDRAVDVLSHMPAAEIAVLRAGMSATIAACRRQGSAAGSGEAVATWDDAVAVALFFIMWQTSDERLTELFRLEETTC